MVTHSSILAWRIPWTEEPGACGVVESDTTGQLTLQHQCRLHSCRSPVNPKKKTSCWYRSKMGLFGNSKALQLEKEKAADKANKQRRGMLFYRQKGGSWRGCFEQKSTHSNILAWKIPWTKEPGRLQSMGSKRLRHD